MAGATIKPAQLDQQAPRSHLGTAKTSRSLFRSRSWLASLYVLNRTRLSTDAQILIILFMLLRCIFCGCGPRKKKGAVVAPRRHRRGHSNQPPPMSQFNGGPLPPPPSHPNNQRHSSGPAPTHNMAPTPYPGQYDDQRQSWNNGGGPPPGGYAPPPPQSGGWVDPSTYNGPNYNYQQEQQQYGQYR